MAIGGTLLDGMCKDGQGRELLPVLLFSGFSLRMPHSKGKSSIWAGKAGLFSKTLFPLTTHEVKGIYLGSFPSWPSKPNNLAHNLLECSMRRSFRNVPI